MFRFWKIQSRSLFEEGVIDMCGLDIVENILIVVFVISVIVAFLTLNFMESLNIFANLSCLYNGVMIEIVNYLKKREKEI